LPIPGLASVFQTSDGGGYVIIGDTNADFRRAKAFLRRDKPFGGRLLLYLDSFGVANMVINKFSEKKNTTICRIGGVPLSLESLASQMLR